MSATVTSRTIVSGGTILDPRSRSKRVGDLLIADGRIFGVTDAAPSDWKDAERIDATGSWVIPGLICLRTHVCEPGYEWKEDVASAMAAAAAGGFTSICARPDTDPVNDVRAVTEQILMRARQAIGARVLPVGAATRGLKGEHLSEMGDLRDAGCVAVSVGELAVDSARMMRRVLEYAKSCGLPVFVSPQEPTLTDGAVMHEGIAALSLGMQSVPAEAEAVALYRDGLLARLTGWRLHAQRVSTAQGVEVLRKLRDMGVEITADVTPHHLWFTEDALRTFDTATRVTPPLRSAEDAEALRSAVRDGLVSCIATDHTPQSSIEKVVEYKWSQPGTTGLEVALSVLLELDRKGDLPFIDGLTRLTAGPADVLGRTDLGTLSEGATADVVVVDPGTPIRVESRRMATRGTSCIWEGQSLTGQAQLTMVDGRVVFGGSHGTR